MNLSYRCQELRDIAIKKCALVNDYCLRNIAEACSELTSLTLSKDNLVSDAGISYIAEGCQKLIHLTIHQCIDISSAGLILIVSGWPDLQSVTLSAGADICEEQYAGVIDPYICSHDVTDEAVAALALNCCHLKSVSITHSEISDTSLLALAEHSRELQSVRFSRCRNITSTGLSILAFKCAQMQRIDIQECRGVENENMLSLRRKYLLSHTEQCVRSKHHHDKSVLSKMWSFFSCKLSATMVECHKSSNWWKSCYNA